MIAQMKRLSIVCMKEDRERLLKSLQKCGEIMLCDGGEGRSDQTAAQKAREMAETAPEPRKSELSQMAEILEWVPEHPARNFREALQSVQFFLGTLFGLYPLNRPDRYLYPYYAEDVRAGVLTRDEAQELIDNFCLHVSTRVFSRAACGFIVGGQDAQGNLVENELTYMFLTALEHIRMPDPNGALAVNDQTSDDILHYSVEILSKGITHPAFYNDSAIVESLMRYGLSLIHI